MNKILAIAIIIVTTLSACDRNEMDYAGKKTPKNSPGYTVTADDTRNK